MEPIAPLAGTAPLTSIIALAEPGAVVGVWMDIGDRVVPLRVGTSGNPRWISLLLSSDLGALAERTSRIVVSLGARAAVLDREELLRVRRRPADAAAARRRARARVAEPTGPVAG